MNHSAKRRNRLRPIEPGIRQTVFDIIFEADSPLGRLFDIVLLVAILASIAVVAMETVPSYEHWYLLPIVEKILTGIFATEYIARLWCVRRSWVYARSFWGIIDLLSFLPGILAPISTVNSSSFVILRSIRLLRVFRVLKLWRMMDEAEDLGQAVWKAREKIIVFLCVVLVAVTISGTLMFHIEDVGARNADHVSQFTSIPQSMYWAIVTMTTVGYGDVVPQTVVGQAISAILILLGYSLIIVPSTFVTAEINKNSGASFDSDASGSDTTVGGSGATINNDGSTVVGDNCVTCGAEDQRFDALYCYRCGARRLIS